MRLSARLWRWNAYLVFVAGLASIVLLVLAIVAFVAGQSPEDDINVVSVSPTRVRQSSTRFGAFEVVRGTNVLRAPLYLDQRLSSALGKEHTAVQNYLFYDPAAAAPRWLVDGPPGLLAREKALPTDGYGVRTLPVVAYVYEQVSPDTDGDQRLTDADLKTIAVSDAEGRRFTTLLRGVSVLEGAELVEGKTIVIVYTAASKTRVANVDLATFRIVREVPIEAR